MKSSPNILRGEMAKHGITVRKMAAIVGISANSMSAKLNGKVDFTLTEARKIINHFKSLGEKHTIESLFGLAV